MTNALWSGQAHMPSVLGRQITIERGEGSTLTGSDGARYFDATSSLWYANIGHGREEMAEAAAAQIRRLEAYHVFGRFTNDRAVELTERLAALSPITDPKIILGSGGSDADDAALKLARHYWQAVGRPEKRVIVSRENAYHGLHAYGTAVAGLDFNRQGFGESLVPDTARVSRDDPAELERQLLEIGPERIAAFITEPVIGAGGVFPPAPGYFEAVQRLCDEHDILLIVDEVITGFGRTGSMFATERYGLRPDMVTVAKGITSGYAPLGGIFVAPRVWEPYYSRGADSATFRHGVTYSGHPTVAALALTNLDIIEREGLVSRAGELATVLERELAPLTDHPLVTEIRSTGLMVAVQLGEAASAVTVCDRLLDHGMIVRPLSVNALQISPPFISEPHELTALAASIRTVLDGSL
ncbi:aspartate aminotransferase family protein [Leucobacter albus]|uniref:Aspartate aminotransferase family protein n=1 Tax=Leucobacter albus TaxID=272210 RepID=A0ABW3TLV4_9MICO